MKQQRSPSKFLSIAFLTELQKNDYCNKDKGVDYVPCEVDELLWKKQGVQNETITKNILAKNFHEELALQKSLGVKTCSKCKKTKNFEAFDIDKSKAYFGLRSHCKLCRACPF